MLKKIIVLTRKEKARIALVEKEIILTEKKIILTEEKLLIEKINGLEELKNKYPKLKSKIGHMCGDCYLGKSDVVCNYCDRFKVKI